MIKLLFKYKYQIILIIIGIVWISFLNELMQIKQQNNICNDCDNYRESASYLYNNFKTHYFRPIGMAIITGIPYLFGATDATIYEFSLIINIIAWLGSSLLLFNFLKKQLPINKALLWSLLFYSILSFVFINFQLLTESIFTFLNSGEPHGFLHFIKNNNLDKNYLCLGESLRRCYLRNIKVWICVRCNC